MINALISEVPLPFYGSVISWPQPGVGSPWPLQLLCHSCRRGEDISGPASPGQLLHAQPCPPVRGEPLPCLSLLSVPARGRGAHARGSSSRTTPTRHSSQTTPTRHSSQATPTSHSSQTTPTRHSSNIMEFSLKNYLGRLADLTISLRF